MRGEFHAIRGGMTTTTAFESDGLFQSIRRLLLEVAEELGPRQALAALEIELVEIAAMILDDQQRELDSENRAAWLRMEQNLRDRQTFLESLIPEIECVGCIEEDEPVKSGLQLVWRTPAKELSVAEEEAE